VPPRSFDTSEAPVEWWRALRRGTPAESAQALEDIARHYQSLVTSTAYTFKTTLPSYIRDEDLISYGQIGLLKAIGLYNPAYGPFRRFASTYVYGAVVDELRSQDWAPRNLRRDQREIRKATAKLRTEEGTPSMSEVAKQLGWDAARVESTMRRVANSHHQTLEGVEQVLDAHTEPDSHTQAGALMRVFVETMETFPPVTQYILARVYFDNATLTEVAVTLRLPLNAVRKLHAGAVVAIYERVYSAAKFS
jgi:RNA polymerase sigma factor for flagellar operon FliA